MNYKMSKLFFSIFVSFVCMGSHVYDFFFVLSCHFCSLSVYIVFDYEFLVYSTPDIFVIC